MPQTAYPKRRCGYGEKVSRKLPKLQLLGAEGASVTEQTTAILAQIDDLLARAGTDKTKLLTAQIWVANIETDFADMNAVWDAWVAEGCAPARWTGEAKLATPGFKVEIIVTAAV